MDERIRVSDADRERVAAQLRDHFVEGRLASEELDERITAALTAKTVGDLRRVMADLPGSGLVSPPTGQPQTGRPQTGRSRAGQASARATYAGWAGAGRSWAGQASPRVADLGRAGASRSWVGQASPRAADRGRVGRGRPRMLPLLLIAVVAAILLPGAGVLLAIVKVVLLFWLFAFLAGIAMIARFGWHLRRHWQVGYSGHHHQHHGHHW